jgi:hypothetical protein
MKERGFDESIFVRGFTVQALATFEEKYKISINIYDIGVNGPEETKTYYSTIYDESSEVERVNLGIIRNEQGDVHFVIVTKLSAIFTKGYDTNHGHAKVCHMCGLVFKTCDRLLQHYKEDHKEDGMKKQVVKLPKQDQAWVQFHELNPGDFRKTLRISSCAMRTLKARVFPRWR